jgi:hypothetical protein
MTEIPVKVIPASKRPPTIVVVPDHVPEDWLT